MVSELTDGVRVSVECFFLEEQSAPENARWAYAYRITIANESERTIQLMRRHWLITNEQAEVTEVHGEGVVGEQPTIDPGEAHTYTSGAILKTETGTMEGSYEMVDHAGDPFRVSIPRFSLGQRLLH